MSALTILHSLTALTIEMDDTQDWIDRARSAHPNDKIFQLQLDVRQMQLNQQRELVAQMYELGASRN